MYTLDARGDRIMDFSGVGYKGGAVPLPNYQQVVSSNRIVQVSPLAGDNLASIQAAITTVQSMPLNEHGYRGVVQLSAGQFDISDSLKITQSGVILRGAGDGATGGTRLSYTGTDQIAMLDIGTRNSLTLDASKRSTIVDKVVPAGSKSFTLASTTGWSAGDKVVIHRPATQEWIDFMGMDDLGTKSDVLPWTPDEGRYHQYYERTIVAIDESQNRVFLDAPLAHSLEQRFGGGTMSSYTHNRISNIGIESIRGDGQKVVVSATNEDHANDFVRMNSVENAWVYDITGEHLINGTVALTTSSKSITVRDAVSVDPISELTGGRRYPFGNQGQMNLMEDVRSDRGRHDFVNNSPSRGPNVFLDAVATNSYSDSGPHQRYSTGTLYDNVTTNNGLNVQNRYDSGTGHGWAGANMVIWNSEAGNLAVQNPPGSQNWLVGSEGTVRTSSSLPGMSPYPQGYISAHGSPQTLYGETSLYRAQMAVRQASGNSTSREYWVGDFDQFENDGVIDQPYVNPSWVSALQTQYPSTPLGSMDTNYGSSRIIPFTFDFDVPYGTATSAVLTLALSQSPSSNPTILLDSIANSFAVNSVSFRPQFDASQIVVIELAPGSQGLSLLNDGQLNVAIVGNRAVDWADLQFTFDAEMTNVAGDVNQDGRLDSEDVAAFMQHWRSNTFGKTHVEKILQGDLNLDGRTDASDAYLLREALTQANVSTLGLDETVVPEPKALVLVALGLLGLGSRSARVRRTLKR
ncbi:dockerin type I domain-containing protein [Aeoliella sp. SH292]|uniref:dockerin type I domain-containing protein n=1 Tax=Aeoliella sp. SH292 TaxID=3454464 RepID=UPI003F9A0516